MNIKRRTEKNQSNPVIRLTTQRIWTYRNPYRVLQPEAELYIVDPETGYEEKTKGPVEYCRARYYEALILARGSDFQEYQLPEKMYYQDQHIYPWSGKTLFVVSQQLRIWQD